MASCLKIEYPIVGVEVAYLLIVCLVQTPTAKLYINYKSAKLEGKVQILHDGRGSVVKWEHGSI